MHGNVSGWTLDQYIPTVYNKRKRKTVSNPRVIPTKIYPRAVRGVHDWISQVGLEVRPEDPHLNNGKKETPIPKSLWWHTDAPFVGFRIVRPLNTPTVEEQKNILELNK